MKKACKISSLDEWQKMDRNASDYYVGKLKQDELSVRQIYRVAGLNRGIMLKV